MDTAMRMSGEDYGKARDLYARFLDNVARIKTARFHAKTQRLDEDLPSSSYSVEDVSWSYRKERMEIYSVNEGEVSDKYFQVQDGRDFWTSDFGRFRGKWYGNHVSNSHFRRLELAEMRKRHSPLWERFTHGEFDDGSKGHSRLWNDKGEEVRFDTETGMLLEERDVRGNDTKWTYQNVKGLCFPQERRLLFGERQESKTVFSGVALNEPLEESVFDMPPLPPARDRFKAWRQDRKTRIRRRDDAEVREIYERFLANFGRIQTARFHFKRYKTSRDGQEQLKSDVDVLWIPSKQRREFWTYDNGKRLGPFLEMFDPLKGCTQITFTIPEQLFEPPVDERLPEYSLHEGGSYLADFDLDSLRASRGSFFLDLPNWERDDGSTGFSRIFCPKVDELKFDTANGMLIENFQITQTNTITFTYQRVNDIWFPLEIRRYDRGWGQTEGHLIERQVVSEVVLNQPIDEALFDLNKPPQ